VNSLKATKRACDANRRSGWRGDDLDLAPRVLDRLDAIAAEQSRQRDILDAIVRLLEHGRGARDQADVALLLAIAEAVGDRPFTSAQLIAHAAAAEALREALLAADITTRQELGTLCRRLEGVPLAGLCLTRVDTIRGAVVWVVRVYDPQTRVA